MADRRTRKSFEFELSVFFVCRRVLDAWLFRISIRLSLKLQQSRTLLAIIRHWVIQLESSHQNLNQIPLNHCAILSQQTFGVQAGNSLVAIGEILLFSRNFLKVCTHFKYQMACGVGMRGMHALWFQLWRILMSWCWKWQNVFRMNLPELQTEKYFETNCQKIWEIPTNPENESEKSLNFVSTNHISSLTTPLHRGQKSCSPNKFPRWTEHVRTSESWTTLYSGCWRASWDYWLRVCALSRLVDGRRSTTACQVFFYRARHKFVVDVSIGILKMA